MRKVKYNISKWFKTLTAAGNLFLLAGIFLLFIMSFQTNETAEKKVANLIFDYVKKSDSIGFKKLYITSSQFVKQIEKSTWPKEKKENMKRKFTRHMIDSLRQIDFKILRFTYKVDWNKAKVDSITSNTRKINGLEELILKIYFNDHENNYRIWIDKILQTENGWKLANKPDIFLITK